MPARTMYEKIWDAHVVREEPGQPAILYIDRHLIHEGTSAQAFSGLRAAGRKVRRPDLTFATMDHSVPTKDRHLPLLDDVAAAQFAALDRHVADRHAALHREPLDHRAGVLDHVALRAVGPHLADGAEDQVLRRDAAAELALVDDPHRTRLALVERLRGEHVLDLARADAEREGAEGAVRGRV